ncbi:MAG: hypothetical protein LBT55_00235 [Clostridiaceae bacterium]|jgi:hypothetical protein|nr:hypothetical protein [Clostridiaceae bacterium]
MEFNPALLGIITSLFQGKNKDGDKPSAGEGAAFPMEKLTGILTGGGGIADIMELLPMDEQTKNILKVAAAFNKKETTEQKTEIASARTAPVPFSEVKNIGGNEINMCLYKIFNSQKQ